jgi:transcriptional regulator of acetoin/glycerol metabolism
LVYANEAAEVTVRGLKENGQVTRAILPKLARLGARIAPLWVDGSKLGEAVYLPPPIHLSDDDSGTLADRERDAILQMLESTGWKLTQSANNLGISRTTLWRRLRAYGLERDSRGRWSQPS